MLSSDKIIRKALADKVIIIEELENDSFRAYFKNKNKTNPKPIVLPRQIEIDENFIEAIGIYIGDGKLTKNDLNHLELSTVDTDIAKFMLDFFINQFNLYLNNFTFTIRYKYGFEDNLRDKWSKILNIPAEKFLIQEKKTSKYKMQDSVTLQINSTILRRFFQAIINELLPIIKQNDNFRHAFLRGEFAADGKLGIEKDTNTYYISEISFCYDGKKEIWLRDFIIDCLRLEGIKNFNITEDGTRGLIRITNWNNYVKFWSIRILDRCLRKKNKFLNVIRQMSVYLELERNIARGILKLSKKEISQITGLHRTNIKRILENRQLFKIEQIHKLLPYSNKDWKFIDENTKNIRIGKLTHINNTDNFLDFILEEKGLKG